LGPTNTKPLALFSFLITERNSAREKRIESMLGSQGPKSGILFYKQRVKIVQETLESESSTSPREGSRKGKLLWGDPGLVHLEKRVKGRCPLAKNAAAKTSLQNHSTKKIQGREKLERWPVGEGSGQLGLQVQSEGGGRTLQLKRRAESGLPQPKVTPWPPEKKKLAKEPYWVKKTAPGKKKDAVRTFLKKR